VLSPLCCFHMLSWLKVIGGQRNGVLPHSCSSGADIDRSFGSLVDFGIPRTPTIRSMCRYQPVLFQFSSNFVPVMHRLLRIMAPTLGQHSCSLVSLCASSCANHGTPAVRRSTDLLLLVQSCTSKQALHIFFRCQPALVSYQWLH
jgi:hypothetical protein